MRCQNFLKVHKNTGEKIFAKYLSADGCFVKTNAVNCDDNDNAMFPNTTALRQIRAFANIETMQKFSFLSKGGAIV